MGQITIYLNDEQERRLREAASESGQPVSRWVAGAIEEMTRTKWPAAVRDLAGQWEDFPELEDLRTGYGSDLPRESF
jgi:predicted transcriptional regulator